MNIGVIQKNINGRVASVIGEMILITPIRKRARATPKARTWKDSCRYFYLLDNATRQGSSEVPLKYFEEAKDDEIHSNYTSRARQGRKLFPPPIPPSTEPNRSLKTANDESPIHQTSNCEASKN